MVAGARAPALLVFLSALLLYVGTSGGSLTSTDAVVTFEVTRSLVDRGTVALPGNVLGLPANRGTDGRYYSHYGIGQSLYNVPFYLAASTLQRATGMSIGKADSITKAAVALGSAVAAAGTVAVVFVFAWLVTNRADASLVAALACGLGSLLWPYARFGFSTALTAWLLTGAAGALYAGSRSRRPRDIAVAGALVAFGCLTRHEFVLVAAAFTVWLAVRRRASGPPVPLAPLVVGAGAGLMLWGLYNYVRFGSPAFVGYVPSYDCSGYYGLLLSPSASVLVYSPTVVLALAGLVVLARRDAAAAWLLAAPALILFVYYGALVDWAGGRSYGPRYLVPVLALTAVAIAPLFVAAPAWGRRAILAVIALSAAVQIPGVLVDYSRVSLAWARTASPAELQKRRYLWAASPLPLNARATAIAVPSTFAQLSGRVPMPRLQLTAGADERAFSQQFTYVVDFWWIHLVYFRVLPAWAAALVGSACLAGAVAAGVRAAQWGRRSRSAA